MIGRLVFALTLLGAPAGASAQRSTAAAKAAPVTVEEPRDIVDAMSKLEAIEFLLACELAHRRL